MIKIYGSPIGSGSRCHWLLEELALSYETITLNMKEKEHKTASYLALNPNGKVPTLVDNDFVVWESCAINRYLAEKYKPEWLGATVEERALVEQWTLWGMIHVLKHVEIPMYYVLFGRGDAASVDQARVDVAPFFAVLDDYLKGKDYMVGNTFTIADINIGSIIHLAMRVQCDIARYTNLVRWMGGLTARPAFQKILAQIEASRR